MPWGPACENGGMPRADEPQLVPELLVSDIARSISFWCGLCGFEISYERPAEGFAYLIRDGAHVMLEQRGIGRNRVTGELSPPWGRGINFQISVDRVAPILTALAEADWPLFQPTETKWYRIGENEEAGAEQFLVMDPDGYLLRFQASRGHRFSDPKNE